MGKLPLTASFLLALAGCGLDDKALLTQPELSVVGKADSLAPLYEMDNRNRIPGRYIVRFKPQVSDARELTNQLAEARSGRVYKVLQGLKGFWGELPDQAIEGLRRNPNVAYIEADVSVPVSGVGDTAVAAAHWPLDRIDQRSLPLNSAYEYSSRGSGVRIWIIDTGVDRNAPELVGQIDETWSATNNGKDPYADCFGHGTMVATIAAGNTTGVARGAKIHSARVDTNCLDGGFSTGASVAAFEFIADFSPRPAVINFSAGRECGLFGCGQTVDDAAKYARNHGVTVVVGAGNDGNNACDYSPAHTSELITVAASNISDQRVNIPGWWASNYGSCVDLFAPVLDAGGTSSAAPMVAGVAALYLQLFPTHTPSQVTSAILNNATHGALSSGTLGSGSPNRLLYSKQPTLTVHINGPTMVGTGTSCTWNATRGGGQPAYQYLWRRDGIVAGMGDSYSVSPAGSSGFDLEVVVTDNVGRTASDWIAVTIDPDGTEILCTW